MAGYRGDTYSTWQEASDSVSDLGINKQKEYYKKYSQDRRLPSQPSNYYKDFPGWKKFLKKDFYPTWQEASIIVQKLGIRNREDYLIKYDRLDKRLPSNPQVIYKGKFPGWKKFIGNEFYLTWMESLVAVKRLNIKSWKDYQKKRFLDPRLRSDPHNYYADFIPWSNQFIVPKKFNPELYHEFKHEKEFEKCY